MVAGAKGPRPPEYVDQRLAKALAHPMRVQILAEVNKGVTSPKEFSEAVHAPLSKVAYHFRELEKFGCLELVKEVGRRGATEHFYRATRRALFDNADWGELPASLKSEVSAGVLRDLLATIGEAFEAGTFDSRNDRHLTWTSIYLDEDGWSELTAKLEQTLEDLLAIKERAGLRMAESKDDGFIATFAIASFESPRPKSKPD